MVADLEHQPNMPPKTNLLNLATNWSPLMEIKKLLTHVHSIDGCRFRASAQHATQVLFIVTSEFIVFPLSLVHWD